MDEVEGEVLANLLGFVLYYYHCVLFFVFSDFDEEFASNLYSLSLHCFPFYGVRHFLSPKSDL